MQLKGNMAAVLAAAVVGGIVGAGLTGATESSASPGAIAAAVQKVEDQGAEQSLVAISGKLSTVAAKLGSVSTTLSSYAGQSNYQPTGVIEQNIYGVCTGIQDLADESATTGVGPSLNCDLPADESNRRASRP